MKLSLIFAAFIVAALGSVSAEPRAPALFSFVFDDGFSTDAVIAPEFSAAGAVACSAVTVDWIGTPGHLTAQAIRGLQDAGWEILSHTMSHPRLPSLDVGRIDEELEGSRVLLEALGVTIHNLVYPYNMADAKVEAEARKYYRSARGGGSLFNTAATPEYALRSFAYNHNPAAAEKAIDRACADGTWLILYHHRIDVAISLDKRTRRFVPGETLAFTPSGATAVVERSAWSGILGTLHFLPTSGSARPADTVTGSVSGATATERRLLFDDFQGIREVLSYLRSAHPEMKIVTIDQGLDILGFP